MKNLNFPNDNLRYVAPPPSARDGRALAAVDAIEAIFLGQTLWPIADDWNDSTSGRVRDEFIRNHPLRALLSNRRETRDERLKLAFHDAGSTYGRESAAFAEAKLQLPETPEVLAPIVETVGTLGATFEAYWGDFTPEEARYALVDQVVWPNGKPRPLPFGLPALRPSPTLASINVPRRLGWINYWSPATCALLGFPDPSRDARWLRGAKQGKSGAWVVRLTDEPLDPERNPEHVKALHEAYARFPEVGGARSRGVRDRTRWACGSSTGTPAEKNPSTSDPSTRKHVRPPSSLVHQPSPPYATTPGRAFSHAPRADRARTAATRSSERSPCRRGPWSACRAALGARSKRATRQQVRRSHR